MQTKQSTNKAAWSATRKISDKAALAALGDGIDVHTRAHVRIDSALERFTSFRGLAGRTVEVRRWEDGYYVTL